MHHLGGVPSIDVISKLDTIDFSAFLVKKFQIHIDTPSTGMISILQCKIKHIHVKASALSHADQLLVHIIMFSYILACNICASIVHGLVGLITTLSIELASD